MSEKNTGLIADPLFVGITRPPMRWGVAYRALILNLVITMEVFVITKNLLTLLIAIPIRGACAPLCARDPRFFHLMMLWACTRRSKDALDALTANDFAIGDHHLTLQALTLPWRRTSRTEQTLGRQLNYDVALARSMLADCGMTLTREDLALEAAFWAQLPGCFSLRSRKAPGLESRSHSPVT